LRSLGSLSFVLLLASFPIGARAQPASDDHLILNDDSIVTGRLLAGAPDGWLWIQEQGTDGVRAIARENVKSIEHGIRAPEATAAPQPAQIVSWYGPKLVIADLAAISLFTLGARAGSPFLLLSALGGFVVVSPTLHILNGATAGPVVLSLAMRLVLPFAGAALAATNPHADDATLGGLAVGALMATVIDDLIVSWFVTRSTATRVALFETPTRKGSAMAVGVLAAF